MSTLHTRVAAREGAPRPRAAMADAIATTFCAMRADAASIMRPSSWAAPRPSRAAWSSASRMRRARSTSAAGGVKTWFASAICEAGARLRDRLHVSHTEGRRDQDVDPDGGRDAARGLDLGEEGVHEVHVRRHADLGHEQHVQAVPRLLHDVHDVAVHVVGIDAVDANADRLAARPPVVLQEPGNDVVARLLLVRRGDGVLEVEEHAVRVAVKRLPKQRRLRAWHRELAPLEPGSSRLGAGEVHARTVARGEWPFPLAGGCGTSGDGTTATRGGSGAAVLR